MSFVQAIPAQKAKTCNPFNSTMNTCLSFYGDPPKPFVVSLRCPVQTKECPKKTHSHFHGYFRDLLGCEVTLVQPLHGGNEVVLDARRVPLVVFLCFGVPISCWRGTTKDNRIHFEMLVLENILRGPNPRFSHKHTPTYMALSCPLEPSCQN